MPRYLIDTGLIIRHLRGHNPTIQMLRSLGKMERLRMATISRLEVHAGMRPDENYSTQRLLSRFVNIDLDRRIADRAGDYVFLGRSQQRPIQVPDAIIAATATIHNLTLVTFNLGDFKGIRGLSLLHLDQ